MKAPRTVANSRIREALARARSVTEAARAVGCARSLIYKRADEDPLVRAALDRHQGRKRVRGTTGAPGLPATTPNSRDVAAVRDQVQAEPVDGLPGARVPIPPPPPSDTATELGRLQTVHRAALLQQITIARDPEARIADRVRAADSALRWTTAAMAALRDPDTPAEESGPVATPNAQAPRSSREVARLIRFVQESA